MEQYRNILISYDRLRQYCPSTAMPTPGLMDRLDHYFYPAVDEIMDVISDEVFESVQSISLLRNVYAYVANKGYHDAVPELDLVLTPTGFGVVSNQNVAPASQYRVDKLREGLRRKYQMAYERIISEVRLYKKWHELGLHRQVFTSLFWKASHMELFGIKDPTRDDIAANAVRIADGEAQLRRLVSDEFYDEMLQRISEGYADRLFWLCQNFVVGCSIDERTRLLYRDEILRWLDKYIDQYPVYAASQAYKANHPVPYENKEDDPCYFF